MQKTTEKPTKKKGKPKTKATIKKDTTKQRLLECMKKNLGNISHACEQVKIPRTTYYKWYNDDEKFREAIQEITEAEIDFVESCLKREIKDGNVTAQIFYLKTKGKKRGYVEREKEDNTEQLTEGFLQIAKALKGIE